MTYQEMKDHYLDYRAAIYHSLHPGVTQHMARKAARTAWRNKMMRYHITVNPDGSVTLKTKAKKEKNHAN